MDWDRFDEHNRCLENLSKPKCNFLQLDHVWDFDNFHNYLPNPDDCEEKGKRGKMKDFFSKKPYFDSWLENPIPEIKDWLDKEVEYLKKNIKPDSKVLDVGCGFGRHLSVIAPFCKEVIGVDTDKTLIGQAKKNLSKFKNAKVLVQDAQNLEFEDNYFDYVICMTHSFGNFLESRDKILSEMKRVCKKQGKIIISIRGTSEKALELRKKDYENLGIHITKIENGIVYTKEGLISEHFSKDRLKKIFDKQNLKYKFIELNNISLLCELKK